MRKLYLLLRHVDEVPSHRDQVGLYWLNDEELTMSKLTLMNVMGIDRRTLNRNLRDRHFAQIEPNKDGWTRWRRDGFTRPSGGTTELDSLPNIAAPISPRTFTAPRTAPGFALGELNSVQTDTFWAGARTLWKDLFHVGPDQQIEIQAALEMMAARFKHSEQPLSNAKDIIRAIMIRPECDLLSFVDFSRCLAMFGPVDTIMLKILSLLTCSNDRGKLLTFDPEVMTDKHGPAFARFDDRAPNCLIIRHYSGLIERVFNDPLANGAISSYLRDERGKWYSNWDEYFRKHPVHCELSQFLV
jgi:hypothetical protein